MTVSATYASDLSRVRIACSGVHADANYALIERSTDQIKWTTVRGGAAVTLSGGACNLDDYEFVPNVPNYYRATYVDTSDPSFVAEGTLSSAVNASVTPGLPAGVQDGDVLVMTAAIRNTAGTVNVPAGWSAIADAGHFKVMTRVYTAGVTAPTVTFSGGVAGADTAARISAYRNVSFNVLATAVQSNAPAADVAYPSVAAAAILPNLMFLAIWKQATSTNSSNPSWTVTSRNAVTAGDDMTIGSWRRLTSVSLSTGAVTNLGGTAAISKSVILRFTRKEFTAQETANLTPSLTQVWLKNLGRPYLNRAVTVVGQSEVERPSRSGVFEIVGRSNPIAVTELRGSKRYTLTIMTTTLGQADDFDSVFAGGDVILLHTPPDCAFRTGYFLIGDIREKRGQSIRSERRYWDLALVQVAAPNPVLVGVTLTWQSVVNAYATWAAVVAAHSTWADLLDGIGAPGDVVVP